MPFATPDLVLRSAGPGEWELVEPLVYHGATERWVIPAGFVSDFASVPGIVTWLVPKTGRHTLAAVLHDFLCTEGIRQGLASRDADGLFRRAMREQGTPPVRRWLAWCGVRLGAICNPLRRPGSLRDLPAVLAIALLALPVVAPAAVLAAAGYTVYGLAELLALTVGRFRRAA